MVSKLKQCCLNQQVTGWHVINCENARRSSQLREVLYLNCLFIIVEKPTNASPVKDNSSTSSGITHALLAVIIVLIVVFGTVVVFLWKKMQSSVKLRAQPCFIVSIASHIPRSLRSTMFFDQLFSFFVMSVLATSSFDSFIPCLCLALCDLCLLYIYTIRPRHLLLSQQCLQ